MMWATIFLCLAAVPIGAAPIPDAAAQGRVWTDSTGKFSVTATLVEIKDNSVFLEKDDGIVVQVPLARLKRRDVQHVYELVGLARLAALFKAVNELSATISEGDTSAKREVLARDGAAQLSKRFNGKLMALQFEIVDVKESFDQRSSGEYDLQLHIIPPIRPANVFWYTDSHQLRLSEKKMLAVGKDSRLWVTGLARLEYGRDGEPDGILRMTFGSSLGTAVYIYLEKQTVRIQYEPEQEETPKVWLDSQLP